MEALIFPVLLVAVVSILAGLILVLSWVLPYIYDLFQTIRQLFAL